MTSVIVIEVNIFASALVSGNGAPSRARALRFGIAQEVHLVLLQHIIETLQRVLTKPYFLARTDEQG